MSKLRKTIVRFARANRYWYTHQADGVACDKANRLQKQAWRITNQLGTEKERATCMQAQCCTMQMTPGRGIE